MEATKEVEKLLYLCLFFGYCKLQYNSIHFKFQPSSNVYSAICENDLRVPSYAKQYLHSFFLCYYPAIIQSHSPWKSWLGYATSIDPKFSFIDRVGTKDPDIAKALLDVLLTSPVSLANNTLMQLVSVLSEEDLVLLCGNDRIFVFYERLNKCFELTEIRSICEVPLKSKLLYADFKQWKQLLRKAPAGAPAILLFIAALREIIFRDMFGRFILVPSALNLIIFSVPDSNLPYFVDVFAICKPYSFDHQEVIDQLMKTRYFKFYFKLSHNDIGKATCLSTFLHFCYTWNLKTVKWKTFVPSGCKKRI